MRMFAATVLVLATPALAATSLATAAATGPAAAAAVGSAAELAPGVDDQPADVFIISTLYRRHDSVQVYSLDVLRDIITRIDPQVLVLDVTPGELAALDPHGSKIEYAQVIFPLVRTGSYRVYAAEPDEPLFSDLVRPTAARREAMQRDDPDRLAAWRAWDAATHELLAMLWRSAGDVNGAFTDSVMRGRQALEGAVFGDDDRRVYRRWNDYFTTVIRQAVIENPGQRILVLVGIQNRHWLVDALSGEPSMRLADVEAW